MKTFFCRFFLFLFLLTGFSGSRALSFEDCTSWLETKPAKDLRINDLDLYRFAAVSPKVYPGNIPLNAQNTIQLTKEALERGAQVVVFPEMSLTGYTLEDGFSLQDVLTASRTAIRYVAGSFKNSGALIVVGAPYVVAGTGKPYNVAFFLHRGRVIGAVPKSFLPSTKEFYDSRFFNEGKKVNIQVQDPILGDFLLSPKQIFKMGKLLVAAEICEDGWVMDSPGNKHVKAGAHVVLNPSASPELVTKAQFRKGFFGSKSAQQHSGYVYVSSRGLESPKDLVYGGHIMIHEDGSELYNNQDILLLSDQPEIGFGDIDIGRLMHERQTDYSFRSHKVPKKYTVHELLEFESPLVSEGFQRTISPTPFVPQDPATLKERSQALINILARGLATKLEESNRQHVLVGLSGGLDSTLALLVALKAAEFLEWNPRDHIIPVTMPGFGQITGGPQTSKSYLTAYGLAKEAGLNIVDIDIKDLSKAGLLAMGHDGVTPNTTYENWQARLRTALLFTLGNSYPGALILGTGDLSETWLGWNTFNGDQTSHYHVLSSVPKTLVRHLVKFYGDNIASEGFKRELDNVLTLRYSPELIPPQQGETVQISEDKIGPYVLHDFFIYYHIRFGFGVQKLYELAKAAFRNYIPEDRTTPFTEEEIRKWLKVFYSRGYTSQFKRDNMPSGPKVGSVSLSPRGDYRMPTVFNVQWIIDLIDKIQ